MQKTNIEYLTHTWSPIAMRCTPVSSGCDHCWHLRMANRLYAVPIVGSSVQDAYLGHGAVMPDRWLSAPLRRKKPSIIGVQFMGDMFHDKVTNEIIAAVFGVMAACPQHTFLVLTKRPHRALEWFTWLDTQKHNWPDPKGQMQCDWCVHALAQASWDVTRYNGNIGPLPEVFPFPNLWIGVSVENQQAADERIPLLLQIPAAKRFVSYEPAIGSVCFSGWMTRPQFGKANERGLRPYEVIGRNDLLNLIIAGAETGPRKRPMNLDWARSVRDQCSAASIPFFFKVDSDGNHTLDGVVHEDMP